MSLTSGTKLGPYEIQSPLGAGGMGEVYRARDMRLDRTVAIKVLPAGLSSDIALKQRLEREAKAVSKLSHPHICALYDIGHQDGVDFLVMEYLEGETIEHRLLKGPLPPELTLRFAAQIADALAKAHKLGITHRDLKPANIMLTKSGAKLMDFGLAKQSGSALLADALTEMTVDQAKLTSEGMIVGTFQYMAPEQLEGKEADARTDIFAFGELIYEMATGKPAFSGKSRASLIAAILTTEPPPITQLQPLTPLALERVIRKCLAKDPDERWQSASDLASELQWLMSTSQSGSTAAASVKTSGRANIPWWLIASLPVMLLLAAGTWMLGRWSAIKPQPTFTRLTYQQGYISNARFAKDGQTVVYSAQWSDDPMQVYSVRTEFPQSTKLSLPSAGLLALSPAGDMQLALDPFYHHNFLSGTMAQAQMAGGTPRPLEREVIAAEYAPDGKTLAVVRYADRRVQLEYPAGKVLFTTSGYMDHVRVSPSGKEVAFLEHPVYDDDRGWVAVVDDAGSHKQLTQEFPSTRGLAWSRTGSEIWFTAGGGGQSADLFLSGVSLVGKQRKIFTAPNRTRILDIAADGRVLLANEQELTEITAVDRVSGKERPALEWFNGSGAPDISPDGKAMVFHEWAGPAGPFYLVVYRKLDGSAPVALGPGSAPKFSPDGTTVAAIVFSRPPQVILHPVGAGESRRLPLGDIVSLTHLSWFPDGKHLLLTGATEGQPLRTYEMDLEGGKSEPLGPADFRGTAVAGDGKRIAGQTVSGEAVVFDLEAQKVQPVPGIAPEGRVGQWTGDGKALLVYSGTQWVTQVDRIEVTTGNRTSLQKVELREKAGSTLLYLQYAERSKTSVYVTLRFLGSLYVVDGLK
jgi:eukaryotic-like serine/threonine-protein kinase